MSKLTLCAFSDEADPRLDGQIQALLDNGITHMEIRGVDGKNISELTTAEAQEIRRRLDAAGLTVWSIGSPTGKIRIDAPFMPHLESFKHMLELAGILGASHYRLFSFYGTDGSLDWETAVLERLDVFIRSAEGSGIILCHENEKGLYGDTVERCWRIAKQMPKLKLIFDPANFIQCGEDVTEAWQTLKPYVEYLHIKDAKADKTIVPAGEGAGCIPDILAEFAAIGGGTVTLEPHLYEFDGLKGLEELGNTSHIDANHYQSPRAAFDTAVTALKRFIE